MDHLQFIRKIESDYLEDALESLKATPDKLVTIYLAAKEFEVAKVQRSTAAPLADGDSKFTVVHVANADAT